ncbi:MAG: hypothetical protein VX278_20330 [Myxococcota bacterium]|nr:hypothetical protein [Myxococcota bacterium]
MRPLFLSLLFTVACNENKESNDTASTSEEPTDTGQAPEEPLVIDIPSFTSHFSCSTSADTGDIVMVSRSEDDTTAIILRETGGYPMGGGTWNNGFDNPNLRIEIHVGTNVGRNHCTDDFETEEIRAVFTPIDVSELPEDIVASETPNFDYSVNLPECEGCVPVAAMFVQHFWFRSVDGQYVMVESIEHDTEILFNYGG